jgi:protein TonB
MVRSLPLQSETRPELPHILAIAAAIAVHAFAFLLLLVPMATSRIDNSVPEQKPVFQWVVPEIPPPPLPPETVPVVRQQTPKPQTQPRVAQPTQTPVTQQVIVDGGTLAADPVVDGTPSIPEIGPGNSTPLSGVQLEYAFAPAPRYPGDAARVGAEGTVLLKILVGTDGAPLEVVVQKGSGNRSLDRAAREHVLAKWRFKPAMRNGQAVQAYGLVPINFTMQ